MVVIPPVRAVASVAVAIGNMIIGIACTGLLMRLLERLIRAKLQ